MSETHLRLLAITTSGQHLHALDMVSPSCGWEEEPSSICSKFIPKLTKMVVSSFSSQTLAVPSPSSRRESPLSPSSPPAQLSTRTAESTARDPWATCTNHSFGTRGRASSSMVAAEPTWCQTASNPLELRAQHRGQAAPCLFFPELPWQKSPSFLARAKKLASFGKKSARCIPGFGMNRHMD